MKASQLKPFLGCSLGLLAGLSVSLAGAASVVMCATRVGAKRVRMEAGCAARLTLTLSLIIRLGNHVDDVFLL
jgi:hypothetical protein